MAFSPDGKQVLIGGNGANILETTTGKLVRRIEEDKVQVSAVAFSPDGTQVITASGWAARLWDAATGEFLIRFEHGGTISSVAFSSHGTEVLTGSLNGTAKLWDIQEVNAMLRIQRMGSVILLEWSRGTLQSAENVNGPWYDISPVVGSLEVHPTGNCKFYRLRFY